MSNLEETYKLNEFYEGNKISKCNQEIMTEYLLQVAREVRSQASVKNNVEFMKFLVTHIKTDLDKLTKKDVNRFIDEVNGMRRKRDGKEVSDSTKKQYRIGLTRFLRHYGEETENKSLIELANFNFSKIKLLRKLPEDLLSREDVLKMIAAANNPLEKALIATIYETGARRGEIVNCRVKDVIENPNGFYIRLNGKTGARQVLFHLYQTYLKEWINAHPQGDNPNAPLFGKFEHGEFIGLDGEAIYYIIKKNATKIGKDCHPHLLRHSIATSMAKTLNELQLKARFGWDPASNMAAVYVHLSGQDVDDTLLESYGIKEKKREEGTHVNICTQCSIQVSPGIRFCPQCSQSMSTEKLQNVNATTTELAAFISQHPELLGQLINQLQANLSR